MFKRNQKPDNGEATQEGKVAIDIGLSSIKLAYFQGGLLCLDEFPLFEAPKDILAMKQQDLMESQKSTIKKAVSMINPKAEFILCPPPSLQVLTRIIHRSSDMDIRRHIEKEFPFDPDQFSFDVHNLDVPDRDKKAKKSDKRDNRMAVAVTDLDFIQRSIGLLGEFQLQIKKFTPSLVALLNYTSITANGDAEKPIILLDIGALYTHLIIYKGMKHFLARTIALGASHFNRELVEKLNVDFETAEKIKTERKLIDDSFFDSKVSSTSMPMFQAVNSILFGLVDEIKNSMTYFEDYYLEDLSDGTIFLTGGGSNLQNLDRFLNQEIDLSVKKADDALHELSSNHQFSPQFATAVGLLGHPSHRGLLDINLINNIEGLLFKLEAGDYFLTKEGFVDKRGYRKKQKASTPKPTVTQRAAKAAAPAISPLSFLQELPQKLRALFKGEKVRFVLISGRSI
ncbi:pilus assembly protein PilM [Thermodesulfobacteriota bacterium]